jgi:hypothetical protein
VRVSWYFFWLLGRFCAHHLGLVPGYRTRGSGFDSRRYESFREVVGLKGGRLNLVRIIEELLEREIATPV